jgi:L-rhamnose mutarotase
MTENATQPRIRKAFVLSVNRGNEAEYEKRHQPIWAELEEVRQPNPPAVK